jgi:uroporphyrinogen-III synthase
MARVTGPASTVADPRKRVIVTRPAHDAQVWAEALQAQGVACASFPLIEIAALPEPSALTQAWQAVPHCWAVMFVSANAVRFFMAARPEGLDISHCRAWSTGPGTRAALAAAGWPAELIDSPDEAATQFDSEALWALVSARVRASVDAAAQAPTVLLVRGADALGLLAGRDWLALTLQGAGMRVLQTVAYVRQAPVLTLAQQRWAVQAVSDGWWWLFSSSEAAQHLLQTCPDLALGKGRALATHPRIAQRLQSAGWGSVSLVPAGLAAQAQSIKSLP